MKLPKHLRIVEPVGTPLEVALAFHRLGLNSFPVRIGEKAPYVPWKEWQGKRVPESQIRAWFEGLTESNFWLMAGAMPDGVGLLVLDVDSEAAEQFWRVAMGLGDVLDRTACAATAHGRHYYFQIPAGSKPKGWAYHGSGVSFDVRAGGGGVIAPPSIHATGVVYRWIREPGESGEGLQQAPPELLEDQTAKAKLERREPGGLQERRGLAELLAQPASEGGRNGWLTEVAGHYARKRRTEGWDWDRYLEAVQEATALCTPPLEAAEERKVAESIWETDQKNHASIPLTDSLLAEWTADRLRARYCYTGGLGWLRFDGRVWRNASMAAVIEAVRSEFLEQYRRELATAESDRRKALSQLLNRGKVGAVESFLRGLLERDILEFDNQPDLLNVANGVVDLRTGELRPSDPKLLFTKVTEVRYDPSASHPDWDTALKALPAEVRDWLQVRIGQAATGYAVADDILPVLQGGGQNGKSTLLVGVMGALGDYAVLVSERVLLANPSDHPTELMDLRGARLALIEETPEGRHLSVHRLKATVGTPKMTARRIRQDPVEWDATHALFLATNYRLQITETDYGTWRRLALVRFPYTYWPPNDPRRPASFGPDDREGDSTLRERLRLGLQGQHEAALAWVVAGAVEWYRAGQVLPPMPQTVSKDTEEWRAETDLILAFVRDRLRFDPAGVVLSSDLFLAFSAWLGQRGHKPWSDRRERIKRGEPSNSRKLAPALKGGVQ
jgi:P4 family phage/plasmid primase-like protien